MGLFADWGDYLPLLFDGLLVSLRLTAVSLLVGLPLGLMLALMVMGKGPTRAIALVVVEFGRGAPMLVLLQFVYFGGPGINLTLSAFVSAVVALAWSTAAYSSEIYRGSLNSVARGQHDAAVAIGLNRRDSLRYVVLPQGLRVALPALMGFAILLFQATSLAFTVTLPEITSQAYAIGAQTFKYLNVLVLAGLLYAAISVPASRLVTLFERRLSKHL